MSLVQGRNVILKVYKTDGYYPIACNSSCTLNMDVEELESTFLGSGAQKTYIPNKISQTLRGNGPIYLNEAYTADDVRTVMLNREIIEWQFTMEDGDSNTVTYEGKGFFTNLQLLGEVNNTANCDYTIRVTGPVNAVGGAPAGENDPMVWVYIATGGEISISDARIVGATVIDVERNGVGLIIVTGTPSTNEVRFVSATGTLTFDFELSAGEYISVLYYK